MSDHGEVYTGLLEINGKKPCVFDTWFCYRNVLFELNEVHGDFRRVFFEHFHALLEEANDEAYVCRMADYVRWILSKYMFVRVERPRGSKHFVMGYMSCSLVFSFAKRFEKMRIRLNSIPPTLLTKVEVGNNKWLRLNFIGRTNYERYELAEAMYSDARDQCGVLLNLLNGAFQAKDEESVEALLNGGDDPNNVDTCGRNALHWAAMKGCSIPLFGRILDMIKNVNTSNKFGMTALMYAVNNNHIDMVKVLMKYPGIDVNLQGGYDNSTALHWAVRNNSLATLEHLLSDDKINTSVKDGDNMTPLKLAIRREHDKCVKILRVHGALEE